ncbi:three-Cys-motif partner protein TcmP [Sphingomonas sp. TDK1]|uniref:three-Cys-motif partner protein TcmP n=1 Tax=Sphingomonas sp. TDK1 TaxID=453247 RepID=UPI0007D9A1A2|nr:three-Cys-motif partner protein TcmP [Sphingomonas sp. TDK1]OAN61543.1 hypothetical protein A7X12_23365 [Sphingomonas sp. TDK1]
MRPDLANYAGREQAYVKHHFLADYVERLVFKVASAYQEVVYVDGYSGPWKDQGENFEDTSFGIALEALRRAKEAWAKLGRTDVRMTALLVERNAAAYARLQEIIPLYPDIAIKTFNGDFVQAIPDLLRAIPQRAFSFVLMDPKGWKIDLKAVGPLLRRPNSEVVFNFMFTMINWSASMSSPAIQASLDALMPGTDWKGRLGAVAVDGEDAAEARKEILVSCINDVIGGLGNFPYVMETPVLFPLKDRTYYSLIYATRSTKGVEVFRDCQHDALKAQDVVRAALQTSRRDEAFGTTDMFGPTLGSNEFAARWMAKQEAGAVSAVLDIVPADPAVITYGKLWPQILAKHGVRKVKLGRMAAELKAAGRIRFLDWAPRKQVPDESYRVTR